MKEAEALIDDIERRLTSAGRAPVSEEWKFALRAFVVIIKLLLR